MEDYVEMFDDYSGEFNKKLIEFAKGDWSKLDKDEQEIAALWKLLADMYNGGFIQFFCNWGFECYSYAIRGLQRMENTALLNILLNTYKNVLDKFKDDKRLSVYWDIPQYLSDEDDKILNDTDEFFYDGEGERFAKMAYEFYCVNMKKTAN